MRKKSLRELKVRAKTEGLTQAAAEAETLDNKLNDLFLTVALADKYLGKLEKAAIPLAKNMQSVNRAMSSTKPKAKSLHSYMDAMFDLNDSLELVESQALKTASALGRVDDNVNLGRTVQETDALAEVLKEMLSVAKRSATVLDSMDDHLSVTNEYMHELWETTDNTTDSLHRMEGQLDRAGRANGRAGRNVNHTNNALRRMNGTGSSTTRGFSAMLGQMNPLTSAYAAIAINVYALSEAFRIINEASNLNRLSDQMSTFSAAVSGLDVASVAAEMRELAAGTLSVSESIKFATKGVAFSFTTEQLSNLTRGAKKASIALGIDFTDAMDRVLRGISKQEIELFDELGVVTRLTPAFEKYAGAVGKTVDQLTDYERQLALTNEVQGQLDEKFSGIELAATGWERLGTATKDTTSAGLRYIAKVAEPVADFVADMLESGARIREATEIGDKPAKQAETFMKAIEAGKLGQAINSVGELARQIKSLGDEADSNRKAYEALNSSMLRELEAGNNTSRRLGQTLVATALIEGDMAELATTLTGQVGKALSLHTLAKKQEEARLKLMEQQVHQQKKLVAFYGLSPEIITPETGQSVISFIRNLKETEEGLNSFVTTAKKPKNEFEELITLARKFGEEVEAVPETTNKMLLAWNNFADKTGMSRTVSTVEDFANRVEGLGEKIESLSHRDSLSSIMIGNVEDASIRKLESEIKSRESILTDIKDLGDVISVQTKLKYERELQILTAKREQLLLDKELNAILDAKEIQDFAALAALKQTTTMESTILDLKIQQLVAERAIMASRGLDTRGMDKEIALLKERRDLVVRPDEMKQLSDAYKEDMISRIEYSKLFAGTEVQRVAVEAGILQVKQDQVNAMKEGIEKTKAQMALDLEKEKLEGRKRAAPALDAETSLSTLQGLQGLSDLQTISLGVGETIAATFAKAQEAGQSFTDYLEGNAAAFTDFSVTIANAAGQMFQSISAGKIQSIDLEIEAEKRRDGKSAESLEKLKRLEKKKIQEKKKADIASVGMSTAVAAMRAYADLGPIAGPIAAGILAVIGAMQIANINKAASGQIASLNDGGSQAASVTVGGARNNAIDVSGAASAGELAFLTGGQGDFRPGRAGGGYGSAGQSYTTGERGPEIVTPLVPSVVTPAGESGGSSRANSMEVNLTIQTMDSESFASTAEANAKAFWDAVEKEANARGRTLDNL